MHTVPHKTKVRPHTVLPIALYVYFYFVRLLVSDTMLFLFSGCFSDQPADPIERAAEGTFQLSQTNRHVRKNVYTNVYI